MRPFRAVRLDKMMRVQGWVQCLPQSSERLALFPLITVVPIIARKQVSKRLPNGATSGRPAVGQTLAPGGGSNTER